MSQRNNPPEWAEVLRQMPYCFAMSLSGQQIHDIIRDRKEREAQVRTEARVGSYQVPLLGLTHISEIEPKGFPACAKCKGITKAFHKAENAGKRTSRGILYDGHEWVGAGPEVRRA